MVPAHIGVAFQEVVVADVVAPLVDGVVPGGIHVVPRTVDLDEVPGGIAPGCIAGDKIEFLDLEAPKKKKGDGSGEDNNPGGGGNEGGGGDEEAPDPTV